MSHKGNDKAMKPSAIKRLVLFTAHYPYTNGESFLEDEVKYAASIFDEIVIVTAERCATRDKYYIPDKATVIESRKGMRRYIGLLVACIHMFSPLTIKEIKWGIREQKGIRSPIEILKKMLITECNIATAQMSFSKWYSKAPTLYYAYWLDAEATYLTYVKEKINGLCIARAHGSDCFFERDYHPYRRQQLESLDKIYPVSEAGYKNIQTYYGSIVKGLTLKTQTVYLGVKIPQKEETWNRKEEATIVSCAEVKKLKRIDLLIDALSLINRPIHWIHFGEGELTEEIRTYADEKLKEKNNIRYEFTGRILKSDILKFYEENSIDMIVNTSDYEGIPVSIMEAMSYGIPAIAKDIGGNSELVDNECGKLLGSDAGAEKIAQAIETLLETEENDMKAIRLAAREKVRTKFADKRNYQLLYRVISC